MVLTSSSEQAKLLPNDGEALDQFGHSSSVAGTTAIIGSWRDNDNGQDSGSAYMYDTLTGLQLSKLTAGDGAAGDGFGIAVALDGTTAIVGAQGDDSNGADSGSIYFYNAATGSQLAKRVASDGKAGDKFGHALAVDGNTAIVGAPGSAGGSAYIYNLQTFGETRKLQPGDAAGEFGTSVAVSGNIAIVGARQNGTNGANSGAAAIYDITTGTRLARLLPSDGGPGDEFGFAVAIDGTIAVVSSVWNTGSMSGLNSGAVYVFDVSDPTSPIESAKIVASDSAVLGQFGHSLAIQGRTAIVGAPWHDDNGSDSGAAYLYDLTNPYAPIESDKFLPSDGAAGEYFGWCVSMSTSSAVIGAIFDDDNGYHSGSAYAFSVADCNGNGIPDDQDILGGASADCDQNGIPDECDIANNPALDWDGNGLHDACNSPNYCTANPNSTGSIGVMGCSGSPLVNDNNLTLVATQLPAFQFGYFLMANNKGFIPNVGGSQGNLCLSLPFIRFNKPPTGSGPISSGPNGTFSFGADLTNLPQGTVFQAGQTWHFQAWCRDKNPGKTSNFTNGFTVMFR